MAISKSAFVNDTPAENMSFEVKLSPLASQVNQRNAKRARHIHRLRDTRYRGVASANDERS